MESFYGLNIDYKFNDKNLVGANYPLKETLKTYLKKKEFLGGDKLEMEGSRFDGLGVPLGLYLSNNHIHTFNYKVNNENKIIDDNIFNKLLDNIQVNKSKKIREHMVPLRTLPYSKKLTKKIRNRK